MFYYAEIDGEYLVINTHSLTDASSNSNYIAITEEQYTSGELVGMYYNSLYGQFEIMSDEWVAGSNLISYNETAMQLSTKIDNMQVEINSKVGADHTHSGYASVDDLDLLEDVVAGKADASHTHSGYATSNHTHDGYATQVALDTLADEVDGKADANHSHTGYALTSHTHNEYSEVGHTHSNYSETTHNHDEDYSPLSHSHTASEIGAAVSGHNHDSDYADINHNHDSVYAVLNHDHDEDYATISHSHDDYATVTSVNELSATVSGKADSSHNHNGVYDASGSANSALVSAKAYADELIEDEVANRDTAIATAKSSAISTAASDATTKANNALASAKTYADNAAATVKNDLLNGAGVAYDTLKELGDLIDDNVAAIEALEAVAAGKANAVHTHTIANITNLQSTLDGKAASSHTHSNATTSAAGLMSASDKSKLDGIASGANKYTLPTASSTLGGVKTTSTVTNASGYTACPIIGGVPYYKDTNTTYSLSSFGVTATAAELNYVDGVTSNIQTQLNNKAVSGHNHNGVYANTSHTHTASDVGAVAIGDIAIVSEVETYLGI